VSISRLDYQKNIPFLLQSFALVQQHISEAKLFILGTGPDKDELESAIKDLGLSENVFLMGFQRNPEDYLKACDLFVISSRYESFGNVIVEAMACGVPIVTTNYGGAVFEIITDERLGTIVEQDESDIFGTAVIHELKKRKSFDRRRSHEYAIHNFVISDKAQEYVRTVARIIDQT
jgi:glycosyltransferase involved in cell wall biosynthesis